MRVTAIGAVAVWAALAGQAMAQGAPAAGPSGPAAVAAARSALDATLARTPLSIPTAMFVKERAPGWGIYEERENARFKSGDPMFIYLEPIGFKYKEAGQEVSFNLTMDFVILGRDGSVLGGKEKFLEVNAHSHRHNTELMLGPSITIQNAPPGDYTLELTVHDQSSGETARARLPFTVE